MTGLNKNAMAKAISVVVSQYGLAVLADANRFKAAILDLMIDGNLKVEQDLLIAYVNTGWFGRDLVKVADMTVEDKERILRVASKKFTQEYGFTPDRVNLILQSFSVGLGWQVRLGNLLTAEQIVNAPGKIQTMISVNTIQVGHQVSFGGRNWNVLDFGSDSVLIISEQIVAAGIPYNVDPYRSLQPATWETCSLRTWLNTQFIQEFSKEEQAKIKLRTIPAHSNPWYGTVPGNKTSDKIFLLSISEVIRYFGDSGGMTHIRPGEACFSDRFNKVRRAKYDGDYTWWWLRTPGGYSGFVSYVGADGKIFPFGEPAFDDGVIADAGLPGVRPAIWIKT